ncbi:CUB and sushi domain-containing protein 3-like [Acanthaster planci]|uniref:CUB and sushi domain-containing protein 3-like n=1 Tax=Acanthaster planci TaxID=133434 RepID=A0A8B7XTF4_ACAPL|nr:CUB and sushi domain-containing protein 3-like [Acanthaster planci]
MDSFEYRLGIVWYFLLFVLGLQIRTTTSEEYMDDLCGQTIQAGSTGGVLHSQSELTYRDYVDCTLTIVADPGRKILLTFLMLDTEGTLFDCNRDLDYLEIVDGPSTVQNGPELAVLCGRFTGNVTSKTNAVTLTFKTDSSATFRGFTAAFTSFGMYNQGTCVEGEFRCDNDRCIDTNLEWNNYDNCGDHSDEFSFYPRVMTRYCSQTISVGREELLPSQASYLYPNELDCTTTLETDNGKRLLLRVYLLEIGDCSADYVDVYDGPSETSHKLAVLCGSRQVDDIVSSGRAVTLRFKTDSSVEYRGFVISFTSFREQGPCSSDEFRCDNHRCIDDSLAFNLFDNCGDNSDEKRSVYDEEEDDYSVGSDGSVDGGGGVDGVGNYLTLSVAGIVAIVIGCLVGVVLIIFCCVFICYLACRSNRQTHHRTTVIAPPAYNQQPAMVMQTLALPNLEPNAQPTIHPPLYPEPSQQSASLCEIKA